MLLSLDYDDCYTRDPELWRWFALQARMRGHTVVCVTSRNEAHRIDPIREPALPMGMRICYTDGKPKRAAARAQGLRVDVWIDDMPEGIGEGLTFDDEDVQ